jgi:hypothetical protein
MKPHPERFRSHCLEVPWLGVHPFQPIALLLQLNCVLTMFKDFGNCSFALQICFISTIIFLFALGCSVDKIEDSSSWILSPSDFIQWENQDCEFFPLVWPTAKNCTGCVLANDEAAISSLLFFLQNEAEKNTELLFVRGVMLSCWKKGIGSSVIGKMFKNETRMSVIYYWELWFQKQWAQSS